MKTLHVNVLLPTYNGRRYLPELLKSLSAQTYADVSLSIRDDCSTDDTYAFLSGWAVNRSNVSLCRGERLGAVKGFYYLLANAHPECEYFAFCDQDDVWLPDKIGRAVLALGQHPADEPLLYCSRVELVDENLGHLSFSRIPRRIDFANALVENIAIGCSMVFNRTARDLICERLPRSAPAHDWWCYLAVCALGRVIFDETPSMKYRQHGNNQIGGTTGRLELFRRRLLRLTRLAGGARLLSDQAMEFSRCFASLLNARDKKILGRFLSVRRGLRERVSYGATMDVWRQDWLDTVILRVMILLGRA